MLNFKRARVETWTREKIESLTTVEVRQLEANAIRLGETEIAALCGEVLDAARAGARRCAGSRAKARRGGWYRARTRSACAASRCTTGSGAAAE